MDKFTNYELEVAKLINEHPGFICLDILGIFDYTTDSINKDIFINKKSGSFSEATSQVDVCAVELMSKRERTVFDRKFKFKFIFTVMSSKIFSDPDADVILINDFPITETEILFLCKTYLKAIGYENKQFIWGNKMVDIEDE